MFPRAASMVAEMDTFRLDLVVRGQHVYKNIWSSMLGEELKCIRETGNVHDLYAVGIVKTGTGTVGHLPKKISTPRHLFLRKGGIFYVQSLVGGSTLSTCFKAASKYHAS